MAIYCTDVCMISLYDLPDKKWNMSSSFFKYDATVKLLLFLCFSNKNLLSL